jgi:hypothetical protein
MVFLNPTILLGLLAASIPVILHFLNLRKIKKVEFSTLSFLKELQKSKIKKIKIKQWILLLLRVLIISFLVSAFARPTLKSANIMGLGGKAKTTAVIILDNTFSMSAVDENGSLFSRAKELAKKIITFFGTGDEVHLIITSNIKDFSQPSFRSIDNVEISSVTLPLNKSLGLASEILNNTKNFNKELYILSDFQKSGFVVKDSVWNNLRFDDIHLYFAKFNKSNIKNLSVTNLKINNQIFEINKEIALTSEISNYSTENVANQVVSLSFNGKRVAQKNISVNTGNSQKIKFNATIKKSGIIEIVSELEEDAVLYDNKFYNFIIVPDKIKILLSSNVISDFSFVKAALVSNKHAGFIVSVLQNDKLKNINLADYDVIILNGTTDSRTTEAIKKYLYQGGGVILFPPDNFKAENFNPLLKKLNIPQAHGFIQNNPSEPTNYFDKIDFLHPIFNSVFSKKNRDVDSPEFYKYLKLVQHGNGKAIITLQDNSMFFSEFNRGKGKLLLFNTAPSVEWSNLPLKNIFAPLINRSVIYLASNFIQNESLTAGEKLWIDISKRKTSRIKIILPNGSEEFINITNNKQNHLTYKKTNLTGIYKFYSEDVLLDIKAVNYNHAESYLKMYSDDEIRKIFIKKKIKPIKISPNENLKKKISVARYGSELWNIFLIIALLLAFIEMFVAKSSKKDLAELI